MAFIRDLDRWRDNGAAKRATQDFLKARHLHRARAFFGFGAAGTDVLLLPGLFPSAITVLIHVAVLAVFSFHVLLWVWFPDGSILSPFTQNKLLRLQLARISPAVGAVYDRPRYRSSRSRAVIDRPYSSAAKIPISFRSFSVMAA